MSTPTKKTPNDASSLFTRKETSSNRGMTSERIAADLAEFQRTGGKVEVLGVTHVLKHLDDAPSAPGSVPARPSAWHRRSAKS